MDRIVKKDWTKVAIWNVRMEEFVRWDVNVVVRLPFTVDFAKRISQILVIIIFVESMDSVYQLLTTSKFLFYNFFKIFVLETIIANV
jgi:hypothetical protein